MKNKILVFIPTYNEKENAEKLCLEILKLAVELDILFVDDNSPDGTGRIIDALAAKYPNIKTIHREGKLGIGSAHFDGIMYAYTRGYTTLITMDADFTHHPQYIVEILKYSGDFDVVVGSRYMRNNSLKGWNLVRKTLTHCGHLVTKHMLGIQYDATGAFRLYRLDRINPRIFELVTSKGYSFFLESLFILDLNRSRIKEIPIPLPARTYGHSKMTMQEIATSVKRLFGIYFGIRMRKSKYVLTDAEVARLGSKEKQWDQYWDKQKTGSRVLYDKIADFYRDHIFRNSFNHYAKKFLQGRGKTLHAGCGAGQVDRDVCKKVPLTILDISLRALTRHKQLNGRFSAPIQGSVMNLPFKKEAFDSIYNLGVMEHFTEEDIVCILNEFNRVLKAKGRIVLFWPPEYGLSVMFFKVAEKLSFAFRKKKLDFYPDEISRLRSKKHAIDLCTKGGFILKEYLFGPRDLFSYCVLVLEKKRVSSKDTLL